MNTNLITSHHRNKSKRLTTLVSESDGPAAVEIGLVHVGQVSEAVALLQLVHEAVAALKSTFDFNVFEKKEGKNREIKG